MEFVVAQLLNGLVYGMLLFLMAAGLSLIFGLMNVVSLAHGSFFMLGAFFGLSIYQFTGSFWLALVLASDSGRRDRNRDGARVHAAALPPRPHGPGAADLRLHLRVLRPGAGGLGPRDRAAAGAGDPPGRHPDRARRVLDLPPVPDRARLCDGAAAVAVPRPQPHRRDGARRRRRRRHGGGARRQYPAPLHRHLRRRRGAGRARRRRGWPRARALSRHGYRDSHPRLHRHRHRRDGKPARRLRRQPADRRDRYLRQGLFPEPRAVPDLSGDGGGAAGAAAGPVRHQVYRRAPPRPRSRP